jgi:HlyD family secretion protein
MNTTSIIPFFKLIFVIVLLPILLSSCKSDDTIYDASGTFEATEIIVSAQANGVIKALNLSEGQPLDSGEQIGYIDSTQLFLKKQQLGAQVKASQSRVPNIAAQTAQFAQQVAVAKTRLRYLENERNRIKNLLKADAATPKQLDDINAQISETQGQIKAIHEQGAAQKSALQTQRSGINSESGPLTIQIQQIDDQLQKSKIINPVNGTVLTKFAEAEEMATIGKPLYSIADLSTMNLRAYITGDQFSSIKLGQTVNVFVDDPSGKTEQYKGTISLINNKAEFTPKTIQTKDERANLVYAIKVKVKNDGTLKIGMYGGINL